MKRLRFLAMAALAAIAMLGSAAPARAQFAINILSGATNVTITDNGPGDLNPAVGAITVQSGTGSPAIPGFAVNVNVGVSKPILGSPGVAQIDLTYSVTASTGGTIQITLSDTGFVDPGPALNPLTLLSSWGGTIANGNI